MPDISDLGRKVKTKYPGQYDDLPDDEVGRRVKAKYPGSYDDFTEAAQVAATRPAFDTSRLVQEQHPDIGPIDRRFLNAILSPEAGTRYLREKKGLEVQDLGDRAYAVRRPGEREWRTVDPEGFDLGDVLDLAPHVLRGTGSVAGSVGGGALGALSGPAAPAAVPAGFVAGGAAGQGLVESGLQGAASLLGYGNTGEEALKSIAREAGYGTAGALGAGGAVQGARLLGQAALRGGAGKFAQGAARFAGGLAGAGAGQGVSEAGRQVITGEGLQPGEIGRQAGYGAAGEAVFRGAGAGLRGARRGLQKAQTGLRTPLLKEKLEERVRAQGAKTKAAGARVSREQLRLRPEKEAVNLADLQAKTSGARLARERGALRPEKDILAEEQARAQRAESSLAGAKIVAQEPREALRFAKEGEAVQRLIVAEEAELHRQEIARRIEQAAAEAERDIAEGYKVAGGSMGLTRRQAAEVKKTARAGGKPVKKGYDLPVDMPWLDYGLRASALEEYAPFRHILRKNWGPEMVPEFSPELARARMEARGGERMTMADMARGSWGMQSRHQKLANFLKKYPRRAQANYRRTLKDIAAFLLGNPKFRGELPEKALGNLRLAANGELTPKVVKTVKDSLEKRITAKIVPERLAQAMNELKQAELRRGEADVAFRALGEAPVAKARDAAERARARAAEQGAIVAGRKAPGTPYAEAERDYEAALEGLKASQARLSGKKAPGSPLAEAERQFEEETLKLKGKRARKEKYTVDEPRGLGRQVLTSRAPIASVARGALGGSILGGPVGAIVGAAVAPSLEKGARRTMAWAGRKPIRALNRLLDKGLVSRVAASPRTPEPVKRVLEAALRAARDRGETAYRVLMQSALRRPEVQEALGGGG